LKNEDVNEKVATVSLSLVIHLRNTYTSILQNYDRNTRKIITSSTHLKLTE